MKNLAKVLENRLYPKHEKGEIRDSNLREILYNLFDKRKVCVEVSDKPYTDGLCCAAHWVEPKRVEFDKEYRLNGLKILVTAETATKLDSYDHNYLITQDDIKKYENHLKKKEGELKAHEKGEDVRIEREKRKLFLKEKSTNPSLTFREFEKSLTAAEHYHLGLGRTIPEKFLRDDSTIEGYLVENKNDKELNTIKAISVKIEHSIPKYDAPGWNEFSNKVATKFNVGKENGRFVIVCKKESELADSIKKVYNATESLKEAISKESNRLAESYLK